MKVGSVISLRGAQHGCPVKELYVVTRSDELLTARELASLLKVSPKTIYRLAWSGDLPAIKISRKCIRFDLQAVQHWLEMRARNARRSA